MGIGQAGSHFTIPSFPPNTGQFHPGLSVLPVSFGVFHVFFSMYVQYRHNCLTSDVSKEYLHGFEWYTKLNLEKN